MNLTVGDLVTVKRGLELLDTLKDGEIIVLKNAVVSVKYSFSEGNMVEARATHYPNPMWRLNDTLVETADDTEGVSEGKEGRDLQKDDCDKQCDGCELMFMCENSEWEDDE